MSLLLCPSWGPPQGFWAGGGGSLGKPHHHHLASFSSRDLGVWPAPLDPGFLICKIGVTTVSASRGYCEIKPETVGSQHVLEKLGLPTHLV